MNSRRFLSLFLGLWLGASFFMTLTAITSFGTVKTTLAKPPEELARTIRVLGEERVRLILRHEAAELNRKLFDVWGYTQVGLAVFLFGFLLFGTREGKLQLGVAIVVLLLVLGMQFFITPNIIAYGRPLDFLPTDKELELRQRMGTLHSVYSGMEMVKLAGIGFLAVGLLRERRVRAAKPAPSLSVGHPA
ncbi:MAG: hypothetical protein NW208_01670 [Bryobacter sp.]|nr:hypothetical protein [Bryobacter sp.]